MKVEQMGCGSLKDRVAAFNQRATDTQKKLEKNPFSPDYQGKQEYDKTSERYGRPAAGSLTERRGIKAGNYVMREVLFLCEIITRYGTVHPDGTVTITFGVLFEVYANYSDKVVGMLLRARKHGLVDFPGEMLYQRQDEKVIIVLLKPLSEIKDTMKESGDPKHCISFTKTESAPEPENCENCD